MTMSKAAEFVLKLLTDRGVQLDDIASIVHALQSPYNPVLTMEDCRESVRACP